MEKNHRPAPVNDPIETAYVTVEVFFRAPRSKLHGNIDWAAPVMVKSLENLKWGFVFLRFFRHDKLIHSGHQGEMDEETEAKLGRIFDEPELKEGA